VLLGAMAGDYEAATKHLDEVIQKVDQSNTATMLNLMESQMFQGQLDPRSFVTMSEVTVGVQQSADYRVLRGMLSLEQGNTTEAAAYFQKALELYEREHLDFESRAVAARYLELIRQVGGDRQTAAAR